MATVTDRCLGSETSVSSGIAEVIDHIIRKEKFLLSILVMCSLSPVEFSAELTELIFLYSNITNKVGILECPNFRMIS